jgi:hypothetical protein
VRSKKIFLLPNSYFLLFYTIPCLSVVYAIIAKNFVILAKFLLSVRLFISQRRLIIIERG